MPHGAYQTTGAALTEALRKVAAPMTPAPKETFVPIAGMDAWAEFWRLNEAVLAEDYGDEETCLELARKGNLVVGGGAFPLYRVGFVQTSAPSMEFLRRELERAERDLMRADYCESTERATAEAADAKRRIRELSAQIERLEQSL